MKRQRDFTCYEDYTPSHQAEDSFGPPEPKRPRLSPSSFPLDSFPSNPFPSNPFSSNPFPSNPFPSNLLHSNVQNIVFGDGRFFQGQSEDDCQVGFLYTPPHSIETGKFTLFKLREGYRYTLNGAQVLTTVVQEEKYSYYV